MNYIELFAGVGGFRYGLEQTSTQDSNAGDCADDTGEPSQYGRRSLCGGNGQQQGAAVLERCRDSFGGEINEPIQSPQRWDNFGCVWSNEWDKYAASIYRYHYGEICESDIRTVEPATIPVHDLIVGGFPCQSFSIAGKRGGFEDTRGTLFFEICRIARACGTKYLWLENVKGLLSHDDGATFQTIIRTLDELGYDCQWNVLNSKNFGVPQNRERVFIIANLRTEPRPQVFPIGENLVGLDERVCETTVVSTPSGGGHLPMVRAVLTPDRLEKRQNGRRMKENGEESFTLTGQDIHGVAVGQSIRRLTPIECERLQAFPDNWTKYGIDKNGKQVEISDSQRYKVCGNAVTTSVITAIGNAFLEARGVTE